MQAFNVSDTALWRYNWLDNCNGMLGPNFKPGTVYRGCCGLVAWPTGVGQANIRQNDGSIPRFYEF